MGGLVDVQRPAVGRERLELGDQGDEHQEERQGEGLTAHGSHPVDVQGPGSVVREDDADQEEHRDHLGHHQILEAGRQGPLILGEQDQAAGGDGRELEEDEQVEDVAGQDHAAEGHGRDHQHRHPALAEPVEGVLEVQGGQQAGQGDQQGQGRLGEPHTQVDGEGRHGPGGEDLHRSGALHREGPQPERRHRRHEPQGCQGDPIGDPPLSPLEQPQQEGGARGAAMRYSGLTP